MFGQLSIHTLENLADIHQQELHREAASHRLAKSLQGERVRVWPRAAWNLGTGLIVAGEWLRARPEPSRVHRLRLIAKSNPAPAGFFLDA